MIPSLPKLIALAAIIWIVWMGFRWFEARQRLGAREDRHDDPLRRDGDANPSEGSSLDLEECSHCGLWVSGARCEQKNCPY
jgi:threonine/homoserine/homoserine lactone efflux protein